MSLTKPTIINTEQVNLVIPAAVTNIAKWHWDRNLVDGTTDDKQFVKLFEELIELWCAMHPKREPIVISGELHKMVNDLYHGARIKQGVDKTPEMKDAIGDQIVVLINICERNGFTLEECILSAYDEIKDRKGRMIEGTFVKEADLPENQIKEIDDE